MHSKMKKNYTHITYTCRYKFVHETIKKSTAAKENHIERQILYKLINVKKSKQMDTYR